MDAGIRATGAAGIGRCQASHPWYMMSGWSRNWRARGMIDSTSPALKPPVYTGQTPLKRAPEGDSATRGEVIGASVEGGRGHSVLCKAAGGFGLGTRPAR